MSFVVVSWRVRPPFWGRITSLHRLGGLRTTRTWSQLLLDQTIVQHITRGFYQLKPVRVAGPVGPGVEKDGCLTCFGALSLVSARVWFDTRPGLVAGGGRTRRSLGTGGSEVEHVGAQGSRSRRLADICGYGASRPL